jgi:hypothetical protein
VSRCILSEGFESAADAGTRIAFFIDIKAFNAGGKSAFQNHIVFIIDRSLKGNIQAE